MRQEIPLNYGWRFKPSFEETDLEWAEQEDGYEQVDLPHTNRMLPYNYIDEKSCQFVSCYKKTVELPERREGQRAFLRFEGVMAQAAVYCNGRPAAEHSGGYTPFEAEITLLAGWGQKNEITVRVDSREAPQVPPFGNVLDYLTYGGIYREVRLVLTDRVLIENARFHCPDCMSAEKTLVGRLTIDSPQRQSAVLRIGIRRPDGREAFAEERVSLKKGVADYGAALDGLRDLALWELDAPALYEVTAAVEGEGFADRITRRFGFRECSFENDGFYLNGRRIKLIGVNRHQSYPYVGYAMPERVQRRDAEILKEAGFNIVRCSHYPQSSHFLDACDELGLMAVEELPGWQHIGEGLWKERALRDIRDMIARDCNHPGIVLWGVRVNESQDDHDFYTGTNELAHREDPTRQTGGVRYIRNSEFLEDVYTYNDFTYEGGDRVLMSRKESTGRDVPVPLLVTESIGHTFPAKRFDCEQRRAEHALRHLRVMDETMGREDLAGEISWCAFDYNTHACFGSGDKICYHGIFDMFRNPKFAAAAYASQKVPEKGAVLAPLTLGARGEKDGGGLVPFYVCTNCDFVRVYRNGRLVDDFYPRHDLFPHLPHPPVLVSHLMERDTGIPMSEEDDQRFRRFLEEKMMRGELLSMEKEDTDYIAGLAEKYGIPYRALYGMAVKMAGGWGDRSNNLLLEGYVSGSRVRTALIGEDKAMAGIVVSPDDTVLRVGGGTYDAVRIAVRAVDTLGEEAPFTQECVQITLDGPAALLGPDRFPLTGGASAFWIRTVGEEGRVRIGVRGVYAEASCEIEIRGTGNASDVKSDNGKERLL